MTLIENIANNDIFILIGIPLLIFFTKIIDVTFSTLGVIFTIRGYKKLSAVMSLFEISVYLFAINQIIENFTNTLYYISYAIGYAMGTYMGMLVEEKLSIGFLSLRVVTGKNPEAIIRDLKSCAYNITCVTATSMEERVEVINAVFKRKNIDRITRIISSFDDRALYTIEDLKRVNLPVHTEMA